MIAAIVSRIALCGLAAMPARACCTSDGWAVGDWIIFSLASISTTACSMVEADRVPFSLFEAAKCLAIAAPSCWCCLLSAIALVLSTSQISSVPLRLPISLPCLATFWTISSSETPRCVRSSSASFFLR